MQIPLVQARLEYNVPPTKSHTPRLQPQSQSRLILQRGNWFDYPLTAEIASDEPSQPLDHPRQPAYSDNSRSTVGDNRSSVGPITLLRRATSVAPTTAPSPKSSYFLQPPRSLSLSLYSFIIYAPLVIFCSLSFPRPLYHIALD